MSEKMAAPLSAIDEKLCTAAQPSADELLNLGKTGVRHVINLALPTSDHAVADEAARLTAQGINYFHLPVQWDAPETAQFILFSQILWAVRDDAVLVHCACNMRASAFVFLYRVLHEGADVQAAAKVLHAVWQPNAVWRAFITQQLADQGLEYTVAELNAEHFSSDEP